MRGFDGRLRTLVCGFPTRDLLLHPRRTFFGVALEARVGALGLPKALRHIWIWNVVDLMRARAEQQGIHDPWHMARNTPARLRSAGMTRMCSALRLILELRMASGAHLVWIVAKLQGSSIGGFVVRVRIVARAATHRRLLKTLRTLEGLDDECGLAKPSVFVKTLA